MNFMYKKNMLIRYRHYIKYFKMANWYKLGVPLSYVQFIYLFTGVNKIDYIC